MRQGGYMSAEKKRQKQKNLEFTTAREQEVPAAIARAALEGFTIIETEVQAFEELRTEMKSYIVGQDEAVDAIFDQLTLYETRPSHDKRPAASFAFVGPRGVGKKHTADVLGETIGDGSGANVAVFDCFNYLDSSSISGLVSKIATFVAYNEEPERSGLPANVIVFDNFEYASNEMQYMMLQILGGITMPYATENLLTGETTSGYIDWGNSIIIFTYDKKIDAPGLGFQRPDYKDSTSAMRAEWNTSNTPDHFRRIAPEFAHRINAEVRFHELNKDEYGEVLDLYLAERNEEYIEYYGMRISLDDGAREYLLKEAAKAKSQGGAYSMMEVFADYVQRRLSVEVLNETVDPGTEIRVFEQDGRLVFGVRPDEELLNTDEDEDGFPGNIVPGLE